MRKNMFVHLNKGFSLIEVLISILIIGIVSIGLLSLNTYMYSNKKRVEKELDEKMMINNVCELFDSDPLLFKTNIIYLYEGNWNEDNYIFNNYPNCLVEYRLTYDYLSFKVFENDEEVVSWRRYRY